jgi:hypothetical protein
VAGRGVERSFNEITDERVRRDSFGSVDGLIETVDRSSQRLTPRRPAEEAEVRRRLRELAASIRGGRGRPRTTPG